MGEDTIDCITGSPDVSRYGIISDELQHFLSLYISGVACAAISVIGVVTNIINIIVFTRQGMKDSTTISLLSLSVTDLAANFSTLLFALCFVCKEAGYLTTVVDWIGLSYVLFAWTRVLFLDISMMTTVFITLERCLSVTMPLTIKGLITPSVTKKTAAVIYFFIVICYIPIFSTQGLTWQANNATDSKILTLWLGSARPEVEAICNTFNNITLPTCSHIIVIVCTYCMIRKLKQSSDFRKRATQDAKTIATTQTQIQTGEMKVGSKSTTGTGKTLLEKDQRVVKIVVMVAAVFIACGLPQVILVYGKLFVSDFDVNKRLANLHFTLFSAAYFIGGINASVNMFIYLRVSSKYWSTFVQVFCWTT